MELRNLLSPGPSVGDRFLSLEGGVSWLNSKPLKVDDLKGKVVLYDFFDYTCINCIRTFDYLTEWYKRYKNYGFEIIGIHAPEFAFAKKRENLEAGLNKFGITYPVVQDNDFVIWNRMKNHVWPRHYLTDHGGIIVEDHSGEGGYKETEEKIQELLQVINPKAEFPAVMQSVRATDEHGSVCYPITAELYIGYERGRLGNLEGYKPNESSEYRAPTTKWDSDVLYLNGQWLARKEAAGYANEKNPGSDFAGLHYKAKELYLVMAPKHPEDISWWEIRQDDKPLTKENAGSDIIFKEGKSFIKVDEGKMYRLINNPQYGFFTMKAYPQDNLSEIYAFTFGSDCQN